jgi:O-antigen/teichoic acid export membrane protein
VLLLGAQAFYRLSGFVLLWVLSRSLTSAEIGAYFFAVAFAEAFTVLASFSLNPVLSRRVAAHPAQAAEHLAPVLAYRLVGGPIYLLCVIGAGLLFSTVSWQMLAVVALSTLFENTYFSFGVLFLALRKIVLHVTLGVSVQLLFLIVFLCGMQWDPSLEVLLGAHLARALCLLIVAALMAHRRFGPLRCTWAPRVIQSGVPFVLLTLLLTLQGQIDTLLLGLLGDYDSTGHYNLAWRIVATSLFVPMAVNSALFPLLAAKGLSVENRRVLARAATALFVAGLLAMGGVFCVAEPLTSALYGPVAASVAPLLRPLTLLFPLQFLALFLSSTLQALYQEARVTRALILAIGTSLLLDCLLIPRFGAAGVVGALLLSTSVHLIALAGHLRHLLATASLGAAPVSHGGATGHRRGNLPTGFEERALSGTGGKGAGRAQSGVEP